MMVHNTDTVSGFSLEGETLLGTLQRANLVTGDKLKLAQTTVKSSA
jgi:hypothetical protein